MEAAMDHILSRLKFQDFDRFWSTFTGPGAEHRRRHGSGGGRVFRSKEDPNEVWVLFDWDPEHFRAFLDDPDSKEIMAQAGLDGPPEARTVQEIGTVEA
ncbi:MAG TPA: hypothetical protein VGV57_13010 [Thermoleophilaceae bacterium]|nr:hypothetical protein [Thermoleophilaceae bacterium]